jgi:serine/threonine-protein kinase
MSPPGSGDSYDETVRGTDLPDQSTMGVVNRADVTYQTLVHTTLDDLDADPDGATLEPGGSWGAGTATEDPGFSDDAPTEERAAKEPGLPKQIADRYERRALLGKGGMGEVWRVWDTALHRGVALKVLHGIRSPRTWARFEEEARVAAQLQHPGIIPVHDIGHLSDGRLWFTMKEVRGRTLGELIEEVHRNWRLGREGQWTFRRLLEGFLRVCETVAYAHARGVVHRDIKPNNIMFGDYGEVLVLDWGIAKVLGEEAALAVRARSTDPGSSLEEPVQSDSGDGLTQVGVVSGTPSYMSPEQAQGRSNEAGPQADVYALGATLYDILTEQPPRSAKNVRALLFQVATGSTPIVPPSERETGAPIDDALDEIVLTALETEEEDRYAGAAELAEELRLWLDGARKRERAQALVDEADSLLSRAKTLQHEAEAKDAAAEAMLKGLDGDADAEAKQPAWDLEDAAEDARGRAQDDRTRALQQLRAALTHAPDFPPAHARLADLYAERHRTLEAEGNDLEARSAASDLAQHDRDGRYAGYLRGTGAVTLHTDVPCTVKLHRYVEKGRRLVPEFERDLGETPLDAVPVEMGSYLLTLHAPGRPEVRYPIWIRRQEHWDGIPPDEDAPRVIAIPEAGSLADDDCYVPAGWFWAGDDEFAHTLPLHRAWTEGFVIKKHPVTIGEYCAYLNWLLDHEGEEASLAAAPHLTEGKPWFKKDDDGRWTGLADFEDITDWPRSPDLPATTMTYDQACGYAAWRAEREGQSWRLPTRHEWVHAARGADMRLYPWGDHMEPTWCQMRYSPGQAGLVGIGDAPFDTTWGGVTGMAGNAKDWVQAVAGQPIGVGGSATSGAETCRVTDQVTMPVGQRHPLLGFRILRKA